VISSKERKLKFEEIIFGLNINYLRGLSLDCQLGGTTPIKC